MKHSPRTTLPREPPPLATLFNHCKTQRALALLHSRIIRKGLEHDNYIISRFISLCTSLSLLSYAAALFRHARHPNVCLWNALLNAHSQHSSLSISLSLFSAMRVSNDVVPDKYTFPSLIKCCVKEREVRVGKWVHGLVVKYGVMGDLFVGSSLIDLYGKCGELRFAHKVFDEMSVRNVVSWTAIIDGYVNCGDLVNARRLFDRMPRRNVVSWNAMIRGYVKLGDLKSGRQLFDAMPERNLVSYTTMIDGYAKLGDMASARFLFDQSPERDDFLWSALISGYAQNGLPNEALTVFSDMESCNVRPDEFVMVSVMSACSQLGRLDLAKWIDSYMSRSSYDLQRVHVIAALIDMNSKCGNVERALSLFNSMPKRDLVTYSSMIEGLSIHGRGVEAVGLFYKMLHEGLAPDDVAFTVILTACSRARLVDEGYRIFDMMRSEYGIVPSPDHYACMVDLLSRSGHLKAAFNLIQSMPVQPHAGAWGALLGACRLHCDTKLAEEVANRLVELEPRNAGNLVLLSNIYAAADRWLDVSAVRDQMMDRGLKKIPGRTWV